MGKLATLVTPDLRAYIYRTTLNDDLTDDLVQETVCQMVSSLDKLRKTECFWAWLFKIALNRTNDFFRRRARRHEVQLSAIEDGSLEMPLKGRSDNELGQLVMRAMGALSPQHRSIISLRCFQGMRFSEIAEVVGSKETHARVSFFRAKQSLKRQLHRNGIGKGALLTALALFGNLTKPATAATVTVAAKSLGGIGTGATLIGIAKAQWVITSAVVAGMVTAGTVCWSLAAASLPARADVSFIHFVEQGARITNVPSSSSFSYTPDSASRKESSYYTMGAYEKWMHFPQGPDGPLIRRIQRWNIEMTSKLCSWLQDGTANYYHSTIDDTVYITNAPIPALDLPTDSAEFSEFMCGQRDYHPDIEYKRDDRSGLPVSRIDNRVSDVVHYKTVYEYNTLDAGAFKYSWPEGTAVVDQRDPMHKRGWTYFRISGRIGETSIDGRGQIPFVYAACGEHPAWLELRVGDKFTIVDIASGAYVLDSEGKVLAAYPPGSFFRGLGRPWMGIRAYDSIRREAAEKRIVFSSECDGAFENGTVVLCKDGGDSRTTIVYDVDMVKDVIRSVGFDVSGQYKRIRGQMKIVYLSDVDGRDGPFAEPEVKSSDTLPVSQSPGAAWLFDLATGDVDRLALLRR
ncbi:MAG: sigma-70 family RNA polymerase sigma factor [Lentisphaerae bacterium]|nr:sigma-70 family RNA polymerase sigma factor [Lentisphaerota bacterium]